jgi:HEAT repeat protein
MNVMRTSKKIFIYLLMVTLYLGFTPDARAPIEKSRVNQMLAEIANYQRGMSSQPLIDVEELIRDTQNQPELRKYIEMQLAKLLESNISLDCKSFICRQLWQIGTADSVPAAAKLLLDEATGDMACYAIGQNPSPEAAKALRDAMDKAPPKAQVRIINLLGDRRDDQSVELLGKRVLGQDRQVAEAAIVALGKIGGEQAAKLLAQTRAKGDPQFQLAATDAYLRCAESLLTEGQEQQAIAIYKELAGTGEAAITRSAAIMGLADAGGKDSAALVVAALQDKARMVRTTAGGCVRTMQGEGVTELFVAELGKLSSDEQVLLLGALADRGDFAALSAVTNTAKSANAQVRIAALDAVGKLGGALSVEFLTETAAKSTDPDERTAALNSLGLLRGNGVDDAIVQSVQKSEPTLRANLIEVLFDRNATSAVSALLEEAASPDANVRTAAFKALGRLANDKDLPALVKLLVDLPGEGGRREAEKAVIAVARKITDQNKQADAVLVALSAEKQLPVKCSLLRTLGGIANKAALEAMQSALKEADSQVQDTAIRELSNWPDAAATDVVIKIFRSTQNQTHRLLALRGIVRLLSLPGEDHPAQKTLEIYTELMSEARSPEEKKLVLSGLANVNDAGALQLAAKCLDDETIKDEAALAAVKIAGSICGSYPDQAKTAIAKVLAITKDDSLRKQAQDVINTIEKFEDFITSWQVSGPYMQEGKNYAELFDIVFPPETSAGKDVKWSPMPAGTDPSRPFVLDLLKLYGGEQRVAYLRTWINCDSQQQASLEIGSDDGIKVWLNNSIVHANNVARSLTPGSDKANITLKQGWNSLLVKITQNNLPWEFCMRLRKPDGTRLEGIRIDCAHKPQ